MKRWLTTFLAVLISAAVLRADVTVVQTTTVEGGMAAMAGATVSPTVTMRVKGMKSRTEIDAAPVSVVTIVDLATRQVTTLRPDQKTATIVSSTPPPAAGPGSPVAPQIRLGGIDGSVKPTGKSRVIDGIKCDEYAFTTNMNMGEMTGAQMPPEAAAMMQGMTMVMAGSMWVAKDVPGAGEFVAFQKAAASANLAAAAAGASGVSVPGLDRMMKAMGSIDGMAYLTEMTMTVEGTGQIADMMKQMGAMKITTKTTSVKSDPLSDDLFKVPEGYTVAK